MAGKDDLANAVLGGASDYMYDIIATVIKIYHAKDEEKVLNICMCILYKYFKFIKPGAKSSICLVFKLLCNMWKFKF